MTYTMTEQLYRLLYKTIGIICSIRNTFISQQFYSSVSVT